MSDTPEFEHVPTTPESAAVETAKALADTHGIDIPKHWEGTQDGLDADHDGTVEGDKYVLGNHMESSLGEDVTITRGNESVTITRGNGDVGWTPPKEGHRYVDVLMDPKNPEEVLQPVINTEIAGMPGLPDFSKPPYTTATVGDEMPGKESEFGWNPDLEKIKRNVPDYYVSNLRFTSMTHYYPFHDYNAAVGIQDVQDIEELLGQHEMNGEPQAKYHTICAALKNFFTTVKPAALATGCAMTYQGFAGKTELTYIRFERDHVDPMTFVVRADTFDRFIEDWFAGITDPARQQRAIDWAMEFNSDPSMQEKGYRKRVCQIAREYPLSWLYPAEVSEYDGLLNGDFQLIDDTIATFGSRFSRFIAMATKQAEKLAPMIKKRDHNLVLTFKGNKALDGLVIGLDKIPPRLENGEFHLGEHPIDLEEWHQYGNSVVVIARKINKVSHWVEQLIKECKAALPDHPYAQGRFAEAMKSQLLASSHFIKELYQINPNDVRDYVEQVANEMVGALNNHGGNIGLDLNTWKVYQYQDNGMPPLPLVVDELNFRKTVYEVHTDRFMELLYIFMYALSSPYIRPYTHKVVVDGNDGIKIGSVRHVKEAGDPLAEQPVESLQDLVVPVDDPEAIAPLNMKNE